MPGHANVPSSPSAPSAATTLRLAIPCGNIKDVTLTANASKLAQKSATQTVDCGRRRIMNRPNLPEHRKVKACQDRLETVQNFIDYIYRNGYVITKDGVEIYETKMGRKLPYFFFEIDEAGLEQEKLQAVEWLML
jgi:hypothetical protein